MPQAAKKKKQPARNVNGAAAGNLAVLDLAGAARFLRLPAKTVERLVKEQGLPGRKIGNEWRFLRAAIERWLEPGKAQGSSIFDHVGMFASDPTHDEYLRILNENRRKWDAEVA